MLGKRTSVDDVLLFAIFTNVVPQVKDKCVFCDPEEVCLDCQQRRMRDELDKFFKASHHIGYLDLHTDIPRPPVVGPWSYPFVRPSHILGAVKSIDHAKAENVKRKLATMRARYGSSSRFHWLTFKVSSPWTETSLGRIVDESLYSLNGEQTLPSNSPLGASDNSLETKSSLGSQVPPHPWRDDNTERPLSHEVGAELVMSKSPTVEQRTQESGKGIKEELVAQTKAPASYSPELHLETN